MASQQRGTEERDSRFWPREKWIPPPRSFTYAIFCEVFDSRSSGLPRSLLLNCTETLATQASNWPSLVSTARSPSPIILWRLWCHKPSHKHDSNKYQSKAFVICDHKSDETRSVTHVNKVYLVWLMFRVLSNQHYQHRTNQKLRSWANAVFQNRGVCGQAFPSFPSFFLLSSQLSRRTRGETLVTQAMDLTFNLSFVKMTAVKRVKVNNGNFNTCLSAATFFQRG